MDDKRSCSTQFVVNNYPKDEREFFLTKEVREEVAKHADVDIAIRGRYVPPKEVSSVESNRLLHLQITGRTKQNLNMAIQKFELMLNKYKRSAETNESLEEKITIGIDTFPSIFRMRAKLLGEHNENIDYLTKETGAIITLRGKGSGSPEGKDDELHVLVKYADLESKPRTQELILNLIETVQQDFIASYGKYYTRPRKPEILPVKKPEVKVKKTTPPPPKEPVKSTKNVSDDIGNHMEKITLGLKHVPIKFNLKSKIYGPNLSNVKHIEKVSSAVLLVEGVGSSADGNKVNSSESPHILVRYMKPELKEMARGLILNLIETIHQEFESLYGAYLEKPEPPEILPIKSTTHFAKPSPPETPVKKPPEKIQSPPVRKPPKETVRPDPRKNVEKPQPVERPVIPPPPVISKPLSPDFLAFTNHSANTAEPSEKVREEPLRSFSGPIETPRPSYPKVDPVRPPFAEVNRPNLSYGMQNIKPIPSIVPPVSSQPLLPTPAYVPPVSTYEDLPDIQRLSDMQQHPDIQPLLVNGLPQYYKKRPISPVDMGLEPKKFCTPPLLSTPMPYLGNIESIDNINVPRPEPARPKLSSKNNRYLVELPKMKPPASTKQQPASAKPQPTSTSQPPPVQIATAMGSLLRGAEQQLPNQLASASGWNPLRNNKPVPVNQSSDPKWPATGIDEATLPPRIPASWNPAVPQTPWQGSPKPQTNVSKVPDAAKSVRKPVSIKLKGPVKHQLNGKPVADGDAVMSFLNECAKSAAANNKYDIYANSQDEEGKNVILIESDEEAFDDAVRPVRRKEQKRSIAIQTDEGMFQTKVRCACGRYMKTINDIRSVSVQTTPTKFGQKLF